MSPKLWWYFMYPQHWLHQQKTNIGWDPDQSQCWPTLYTGQFGNLYKLPRDPDGVHVTRTKFSEVRNTPIWSEKQAILYQEKDKSWTNRPGAITVLWKHITIQSPYFSKQIPWPDSKQVWERVIHTSLTYPTGSVILLPYHKKR